jgi:sarcosine oxidase subunit gamma
MAELAVLPKFSRYSLRGDQAALTAGCAAFGVPVPGTLHAATQDSRSALWLGPDEILLLASPEAPPPRDAWVVDISERQAALRLSGSGCETALAAGCPLDLQTLGVGQCTRTLLGKADIVLWRTAPLAWHIEVWRSFVSYAQALLERAVKDWP